MRLWPFGSEHRADANATDAIVAALVAAAGGSGVAPTVETLGAVEAAAGLWAQAFASATVNPQTPITRALTPSTLAAIGRGLAVRGEAVFLLEVDDDGLVRLTQASTWKVSGSSRPESWRYAVEIPAPGGVVKRTIPADGVVHVRYATRPGAPWAGVSPLGMASETQALAAWLERRLAEEASTATSYVLPLPESRGGVDDLKADIKAGRGKLHIVDTTAAGWGEDSAGAPQGDWKTQRLGASPPAALGSLRGDVKADILAAYGITVASGGTASREAWRQSIAGTVVPLSRLVAEELAAKLDAPALSFEFPDLRAADLVGRARSFKALVDAGMDLAEAAAVAGLE